MDDVDKLSDAELRVKLMEYGLPPLPVTGTTRKIMMKKLKLLMGSKSNANVDGRRSLGRYSSGEDSDSEDKTKRSKRRVTISAAPMQPPPSKAQQKTKVEPVIVNKPATRSVPARGYTTAKTYKDDFDTGSDSEQEIELMRRTNDYESSTRQRFSSRSSLNISKTTSHPESPKAGGDSSYSRTFSSASSRPSAVSSPVSADAIAERMNQIKWRLNNSAGAYSTATASHEPPIEKADTPFLSQFTKRLSQLSASKKNANTEQDTNGGNAYPSSSYPTSVRSYLVHSRENYDRVGSDGKNLLQGNFVPFAVLGVAVLFFIFVGFIYLGMRSDTSLEASGLKVPYCDVSKERNHIKGVNCVVEEDVKKAVHLLQPLKNELKERGINKICGSQPTKERMEEKDVLAFVESKFGFKNQTRVLTDLRNLEVLITKNPKLEIKVVQALPNEEITEKHIVTNLEKLERSKLALVFLNPAIPWTCSIANQFYWMFKTILSLALIFASVYLSYMGYLRYMNYQRCHRNEVISLVERILEILQNGIGNELESNYVIINHVRDMIIPVTQRKAKEKIWKQAVLFITENESRVRTEVQEVQGEEYFVWRWIGSGNLSVNASRNKSWQGQAFETQTGAVNSLPCSPTPCLKIRGMVEDGDRETQQIREAVLSKCASKCRILHCYVDDKMKCVYMKCADTEDAAVAYQNLHGWWYAGQLVTVKYLRLERYMQRFPDSPVTGPPYLRATLPVDGWS